MPSMVMYIKIKQDQGTIQLRGRKAMWIDR